MSSGTRAKAVNVWWVGLDVPLEKEAAEQRLLSADERAQADRLAPAERRRFIVSHAALRSILGHHLGRPPADLRFAATPAGKPSLVDAPLCFTLSHSWDWAIVAIADRAVGIDLERIAPIPEIDAMMNRFLSSRERACLAALPAAERLIAFHHCWCGKEAYLKALGCGLSMDPACFSVAVAPAAPALLDSPLGEDECRRWRLVRLAAPRRYAAALAVEGPLPAIAESAWI
jgi:4'-phosphopantetheinyl transferase